MEVLAEIVRNLLVIIIMASFFELLLPDGNIKPFVRLAIGLFVLIAILHPALAFLYDHRDFKINAWDYQMENNKEQEIMTNGQNINRQIMSRNNEAIREKIEGQISAMAMLVPGVDDARIKARLTPEGSLQEIDVTVNSGPRPDTGKNEKVNVFSGTDKHLSREEQQLIKKKLTMVINNLYGLTDRDININFEGV